MSYNLQAQVIKDGACKDIYMGYLILNINSMYILWGREPLQIDVS